MKKNLFLTGRRRRCRWFPDAAADADVGDDGVW